MRVICTQRVKVLQQHLLSCGNKQEEVRFQQGLSGGPCRTPATLLWADHRPGMTTDLQWDHHFHSDRISGLGAEITRADSVSMVISVTLCFAGQETTEGRGAVPTLSFALLWCILLRMGSELP